MCNPRLPGPLRLPKRWLRDERGTMAEIPFLVVMIVMAVAAAVGQPTLGRGVLAAGVAVLVFLGAVAALVSLGRLMGWVSDLPWVRRIRESGCFRFCADWAPWVLLALFLGAAGCFFGLVLSPAAQVRAGLLSGLALAVVPILYHLAARLRGKPGS